MFVAIDYETLEMSALAMATSPPNAGSFRTSSKSANFAGAYGEYAPATRSCDTCGAEISRWAVHTHRDCKYYATKSEMTSLGFVPPPPLAGGILRAADVKFRHGPLKRKTEKKTWQSRPLQQGDFVPVWAVLVYNQAQIGNLTSHRRPQVRAVITELKRIKEDPDAQKVIMAEHILEGGPYTGACQALVGRLAR